MDKQQTVTRLKMLIFQNDCLWHRYTNPNAMEIDLQLLAQFLPQVPPMLPPKIFSGLTIGTLINFDSFTTKTRGALPVDVILAQTIMDAGFCSRID